MADPLPDDVHPSLWTVRTLIGRARSVVLWDRHELLQFRLAIGRATKAAVRAVGPSDELREAVEFVNSKIKAFPLRDAIIEPIVIAELEAPEPHCRGTLVQIRRYLGYSDRNTEKLAEYQDRGAIRLEQQGREWRLYVLDWAKLDRDPRR